VRPVRRVDIGEVERGDRGAFTQLFELLFPVGNDTLGFTALSPGLPASFNDTGASVIDIWSPNLMRQ
jgi:hypothetical protein